MCPFVESDAIYGPLKLPLYLLGEVRKGAHLLEYISFFEAMNEVELYHITRSVKSNYHNKCSFARASPFLSFVFLVCFSFVSLSFYTQTSLPSSFFSPQCTLGLGYFSSRCVALATLVFCFLQTLF